MEKALVTVCITSYNVKSYLPQAIEGVLMQETGFPFEIVIGDDGSTDGTRELCLAYKEKYPGKIKLVLHDVNVGVNRNDLSVINRAAGKYIAWCDGDDYWVYPHKLQEEYDVLEQYGDVALVHTDWIDFIEAENRFVERKLVPDERERTGSGKQCIEMILRRETSGCRFSSSMFRKEYYLDVFGRDPELFLGKHVCNDLACFIAMYEKGRFYHIPKPTTVYRIRKESLSVSENEMKRFRYTMGLYRLYAHIIRQYDIQEGTRDIALRGFLGGLLKYAFYNQLEADAIEIKEIAGGLKKKLSYPQQMLYWGSRNKVCRFFIKPFFDIYYRMSE